MLILEVIKAGNIFNKKSLLHVCFWVQVYDLPVGFMSPVINKHLGNFIGEFSEYDVNNGSEVWRTFIRVREHVDVRAPLKKEKKVC